MEIHFRNGSSIDVIENNEDIKRSTRAEEQIQNISDYMKLLMRRNVNVNLEF